MVHNIPNDKTKKKWTILQWGKHHITDSQIDIIIDLVEENLTFEGHNEDRIAYVNNEDRTRIKKRIKIILER